MIKINFYKLLFLLCLTAFTGKVKAQSDIIPVPTYNSQAEMPMQITPEQKMLRELPRVVVYNNGADYSTFESSMNKWLVSNENLRSKFDPKVNEMIKNKNFREVADLLVDFNHFVKINANNPKGGNHE